MLFAFARDGWGPAPLGRVSSKTGAPVNALTSVVGLAIVATLLVDVLWTSSATNVYFYVATIGVLALLIVYALASLGAFRFLFLSGVARAPRREMIVPLLATAYLGYVLYKQFSPAPPSPYNVLPYIAIGWTVLGLVLALARPAQARRMGEMLSREVLDEDEPAAEAVTT